MAILATVFSFFIIQILIFVTSTEADPKIDVHPSEITPGMSSSLDINCSFSSVDHPEMAEVASLILSKANSSGQNFQDLAQITLFSPNSVIVLTQEKVTATGVHSQTGVSFIEVTWEFPTATQGGVYRCSAHGLDTLGQPIEMANISTVTVGEANLNVIFENFAAMENRMSEMENYIQALEYNNSQMSSYITDQENTITGMEKNIQDLQNKTSQMSSYITDLQSLQRSNLDLHVLGSYQNHDYYISKEGFGEINNALDVCKSCGGYLTEIDNESEFNATKSFLDLTYGFDIVMIAGTDEASDGTWILQSNQQPLPFTSWFTMGAFVGTSLNCLGLDRRYSWDMDDFGCKYDPPHETYRFLCEIPRV